MPGLLEWPAAVRRNAVTWHPAYVADFLPTVLELLGVPHAHPGWCVDGGAGAGGGADADGGKAAPPSRISGMKR